MRKETDGADDSDAGGDDAEGARDDARNGCRAQTTLTLISDCLAEPIVGDLAVHTTADRVFTEVRTALVVHVAQGPLSLVHELRGSN